jgi:ribosomal protein S18 acetylase RimI-like enzyme
LKTSSKPGSADRVSITRLSADGRDDFARIHSGDHGWCQCVAWWVPTWDDWGNRTAEENTKLRDDLFARRVHDGFLIHANGALAGWCQAYRRDAFPRLQSMFALPKDEGAWMIGCLYIKPAFRQQGIARTALALVVDALRGDGARRIDVFPKRNAQEAGELWNGPESTYLSLGFKVVRDDPKRPLLRLET